MSIIEVKHVSKEYRLGTLTNLKDSAVNMVRRLRRQPVIQRTPFRALDDLDFSIDQGEVVAGDTRTAFAATMRALGQD